MKTDIPAATLATPRGARADEILRSCVHCGFCNATCPTYQVRGNELDGPRGRIYLIKDMLESGTVSDAAKLHLDRCLTCRACETTCPSGVPYGELAEIGREIVAEERGRGGLVKRLLLATVPRPRLLQALLRLARPFRWLAPKAHRRLLRKPPPSTTPQSADSSSEGRPLPLARPGGRVGSSA
ncbi:MAG: 4Fe-4S dicluster domain-containing protein, partial [Gammaproteobacteria bacterium]|nr:4Fe-4S dicluster domain-containing protein [Gammaproteobacteria bacterium]